LKSVNISRKPKDKVAGEATRRIQIMLEELKLEIEKLKERITALGG
tara:strand:+ start:72 stop:209 length:138 start_codon:yes stop_codon:yes gene_type:complete